MKENWLSFKEVPELARGGVNITLHKTKHKTLSPTWMSDKLLNLIVSENRAPKRAGGGEPGAGGGLQGQSCYTNAASEEQKEQFRTLNSRIFWWIKA